MTDLDLFTVETVPAMVRIVLPSGEDFVVDAKAAVSLGEAIIAQADVGVMHPGATVRFETEGWNATFSIDQALLFGRTLVDSGEQAGMVNEHL